MTLVVTEVIEGQGNSYLVTIKGKFTKIHQTGGKIPKSMRFDIYNPTHGGLSTSSPKPLKYEVIPI
jgi:hypothetical protein